MRNDGFTLIEMIAALTLAGILAAVAMAGIVSTARGYIFSRVNDDISQKAQLVIARLFNEISELSAIDAGASNTACIRYKLDTVAPFFRTVAWHDSRLEIKADANADCGCPSDGDPGDILAGQVGSFNITYVDGAGAVGNAPPAETKDLYEVRVAFRLERSDGVAATTFSFRANPRNNGISNGP